MSNQQSQTAKNQVFTKVKTVTNKDKIIFFTIALAALGFLCVTFASNLMTPKNKNGDDAQNQGQKQLSSQANIPANSPSNFNRMPDYIEQNHVQRNAAPAPVKTSAQNLGDTDVGLINEKQLDAGAQTANTEPERVTQQLKAQESARAVEDDEIYLGTQKKGPKSPYEIIAGTFIPATLETGLNSDLAGYATAVVRQNVYDTVTGNFLLIPKGSRLFGKYESKVAYGQSRLLLNWNRIIFADGASISIKGMNGTDKAGYSGFADQVDNHFASLLSGAVLMSIIGSGAQLSQPQTSNTGVTPSQNQMIGQTVAGQTGNQIANVSSQLVQKNMNIAPTINIRPGYEFNVIVNKDMILDPIDSDGK